MAQDTYLVAESVTSLGQLKADQGHLSTDGVAGTLTTVGVVTTNLNNTNQFGGVTGGVSGAAITISGTISAASRTSKVLPGSAVTSCVLGTGTQDGQEITVVNLAQVAGSSVSFAAAGSATSHLATVVVISGLTAARFIWDANTAVWYPIIN
jgi:hypothetical protein